MKKYNGLPKLTEKEKQISGELTRKIVKIIDDEGGYISFHNFMDRILYDPKLGYYMNSRQKFGSTGDFITAPMLSSLFAHTLGKQFALIINKLGKDSSIVEFGAGTGQFALDCLRYLKNKDSLPKNYHIVELNVHFKTQQQILLKQYMPEYYSNIQWHDKMIGKISKAIIFANEILDAMPIELVEYKDNKFTQLMVKKYKNTFEFFKNTDLPEILKNKTKNIALNKFLYKQPYVFEIHTTLQKWISNIKEVFNKGVVFICDYGYQRKLYYSPERTMGTLRCYYKHHVHNNPLINVGIQDVTAHVDFTTVAEAAVKHGLIVEGFLPQGTFLTVAGIIECYEELCKNISIREKIVLTQCLKNLTLGTEMAENFKVIVLSYKYDDIIEPFKKMNADYLL